MARLHHSPRRIGLDVESKRLRERLQTIFPHDRLVPAPREAKGPFAAVFVEIDEDGTKCRDWVKRGIPTLAIAARPDESARQSLSDEGVKATLTLPLDHVQTRLALEHALPTLRGADLPTLNLAELERLAIDEALRRTGRSVPDAAQLLGVGRSTLYRRVPELFPPSRGRSRPPSSV